MKLKDIPTITEAKYQKRLFITQTKCFDIPLLPAPSNEDYFMAVYNEHKANDKAEKLPKVMKTRTFIEIEKKPRKIVDYNKPFEYKGREPRNYDKPASANAKTHYAVIDHVGSLSEDDMKAIYKKVFAQTAKDGYEKDKTCFTMKNFCKRQYNRYTSKPLTGARLQSMKYAMRNQKNPEQVYFICPQLYKSTEREVRKWAERGIPVTVYEVNEDCEYKYEHFMMSASTDPSYEDFEATHKYAWDSKADTIRRLVDMLAPAFGIMLSAPAIRFDRDRVPDNYLKRPDFDRMTASGETHLTKPFTSSAKFLTTYRCVATDEEVRNAWRQIANYLMEANCTVCMEKGDRFGSITGDIVTLKNEYLDIDYMICEQCGRPMKMHQGENECWHCGAVYEEDVAYSVFYDDAYFEDCEFYAIDQTEDAEYTEDQYWKDLEAEYDF